MSHTHVLLYYYTLELYLSTMDELHHITGLLLAAAQVLLLYYFTLNRKSELLPFASTNKKKFDLRDKTDILQ